MDMSLLKTLFYGLISGITEILPVSSHAHRLLILKIFGENREPELLGFLIDLAVLAALYLGCSDCAGQTSGPDSKITPQAAPGYQESYGFSDASNHADSCCTCIYLLSENFRAGQQHAGCGFAVVC